MRACLAILTVSLQVRAAVAETPVRLAVVPQGLGVSTVADLLTTELSRRPNLQVLERAEIERIYREQNLSVANRDYLKLGKVLGANGLVFLDLGREGTNELLRAQLVAVNPGVIIGDSRVPWPLKDNLDWAAFTARRFQPLCPKLTVLAKDALPISVVAMRAATRAKEQEELERQLTLMLIARLSQERELFVLERRRMGELMNEKELNGTQDSPFWAGSYLIEGTLDRDGYSAERATVHARVKSPQGQPIELQVAAKRSDPRDLVEQLARGILKSLQRAPGSSAWDPAAEANSYLEESSWQFKWGLFQEARGAADAAWALGRRDFACALARVRAGVRLATPDRGRYNITDAVHFFNPDIDRLAQPAEIGPAKAVLELYDRLSEMLKDPDLQPNSPWYPLGVEALVAASRVLQNFSSVPKAQPAVVDQLAELRFQARKTAAWIAAAQKRYGSLPAPKPLYRSLQYDGRDTGETEFQVCQADWGCFWQDSPDAAVAVYRELLKSSARRYCSVQLLPKKGDSYFAPGRDANLPLLVAWNEEDRRRLPTLTAALIEEVKAQTRVAAKAPASKLSAKAERDYAGLDRSFPAATFEARRDYLKTNTEMDFGYFHHLFGVKSEYTRDEAARLQPLLAEYRSNISKTFVTEDDRIRYTRSLETAIYVLWRNLGSAPVQPSLAPAPVCTNCIQVSRFLEVPQQLVMEGKRREQLNASTILGHGYSGERLWLDVRYGRSYAYSFNGGAGWVDTNGAAVAILDPDAGSWELIRYPESNAKPFSESTSFPNLLSPVPGFEDFEHNRGEFCVPFEGALFLSEWNSLIRYSLESRRWVTLPVPWQIPTELFVVKDQLLAANREGIYQLVNGGERINVLASARRSPAVSILDSMDSFGRVRLFPGPGNTVRALLLRGVYSWDGREWTKLFSASKVWRSEIREGGAFFMIQLFDEIPGLWFLPDDRNELELCLTTPPGTLSAHYVQPTPPAKTNAIPTWRSPWGGKLTEAAVGTFGSNVLLFVEQSPINDYLGNNGANDGRTGNLIYLERGRTNGFLVPLKFDSNQGPFHRHLPDYQMGTRFPYDLTWLVVTPKFVFIGQDKLRGVWTFPTAELDAAIAREKARMAAR